MPPPSGALGDIAGPTISPRRGAVVAMALAGTVLLVVGYGSGIGIVPSASGGTTAAAAPPAGPTATTSPPGLTLPPVTPPDVSLGNTGLTSVSPPSLGLPDGLLGPPTVSPWLPGQPGQPGRTTTPPSTAPPSTAPPTSRPPATRPPAGCTGLVDDLLAGLTSYLGLGDGNIDMGLVRQVNAVLGLDRYLGRGKPLTEQLTAPMTPVLDAVPAVTDLLGLSVLGLGSGAAPTDDATLLGGLRSLLGVDLGAVTRVTGTALQGLLDAVVGGC